MNDTIMMTVLLSMFAYRFFRSKEMSMDKSEKNAKEVKKHYSLMTAMAVLTEAACAIMVFSEFKKMRYYSFIDNAKQIMFQILYVAAGLIVGIFYSFEIRRMFKIFRNIKESEQKKETEGETNHNI
jgi:FtsH-binding integral membrane protein